MAKPRLKDLFTGIKKVATENMSSRRGSAVRCAVVHTTESADGSLWNIVAYFQRRGIEASSHYVIADRPKDGERFCEVVQVVPEEMKAWTARSANPVSVNYELIGRAARTRDQWMRDYYVQMETCAALIAEDVIQYQLPVKRDYPGILGHCDLSAEGFPNNHWDPGPGFPWDVFLPMVERFVKELQAPEVKVVNAKGCPRPQGIPARIPAWAWALHAWMASPKRDKGPRPTAPRPIPAWFWVWRAWKLGISHCEESKS